MKDLTCDAAVSAAVTIMTLAVGAALVAGGLWPGDLRASLSTRLAIWFDILAAFAFIAGARSVVGRHAAKFSARETGWRYSAITVTAFVATLCAGLFKLGAPSWETPLLARGTWFRALDDVIYVPAASALAIVVAFALVSALYGAARRRARDLWLLLACACCVVAAHTPQTILLPGGDAAPAWARAFAGAAYAALVAIGAGAQRALMIGIAADAIALALRTLLRRDERW